MARTKPPATRITAKQAIALLSDPTFRDDVASLRAPGRASGEGEGDDAGAAAIKAAELAWDRAQETFKAKWGRIVPPQDGALLHPDPRRAEASALLSGRWGLVRVFPWTTEKGVVKDFRQIHREIGRAERQAKNANRAALAQWLARCGFPGPEIAGAVWGKQKNRRKLSDVDRRLARYLDAGEDYTSAERKAYRSVQGTEGPGAAVVRVARRRHEKAHARQRQEFRTPVEADPLSACIMKIVRLKYPTWPIPFVAAVTDIAESLDSLLDELRSLLLASPSA